MHTYRWNGVRWVDAPSQSITLNAAGLWSDGGVNTSWGQDARERCRLNGPGGTVTCSVRNVTRIALYSPNQRYNGFRFYAGVYDVSWRDDRGVAHYSRSDLSQVWAEW
jgi:hypothetical protein